MMVVILPPGKKSKAQKTVPRTWQIAEGMDPAFEFSRSHFDQASMGPSWLSGGPEDLYHRPGARHHRTRPAVLSGDDGSDLIRHVPQMIDWIRILGIWRPGWWLQLFATLRGSFPGSLCGVVDSPAVGTLSSWSVVSMSGCFLSAAGFWVVVWVRGHPHEWSDPRFPSRTLHVTRWSMLLSLYQLVVFNLVADLCFPSELHLIPKFALRDQYSSSFPTIMSLWSSNSRIKISLIVLFCEICLEVISLSSGRTIRLLSDGQEPTRPLINRNRKFTNGSLTFRNSSGYFQSRYCAKKYQHICGLSCLCVFFWPH